jgi:hypothetical protein
MMASDVIVSISQIKTTQAPPSTSVEFVVRNNSIAPIWLVNDQWLIWRQRGQAIELSLQRGPMRPGAQVFGYFSPAVVNIESQSTYRSAVELRWPQPLDLLWNSIEEAAPAPGVYQTALRIGYGLTAEPEPPKLGESVEAPVLRWQREAVSAAVAMKIPEYKH